MDNFEVTCHGPADPIKFYLREGYREPETISENPLRLIPEDPKTPVRDYPRPIDYIHGFADGFSYSSYDRLVKQRQMGVQRIYGNETIYRLPVTNTMMYGWPLVWKEKDILGNTNWYETRVNYKVPSAEITRYQSDILRANPTSFLFCTFY